MSTQFESGFESLFKFLESPSGVRDFDEQFCHLLADAFNAELASILEYHPKRQKLVFRYSMDLPVEQAREFEFRIGEGIAGTAFSIGKVIAVYDASQIKEHSAVVDTAIGRKTGAMMAIPVRNSQGAYGVIEILNRRNGIFSDSDKLIGRAIGILYARHLEKKGTKPMGSRPSKRLAGLEDSMLGASHAMESVLRVIQKAAATDWPVLILGETGTGKELVSRRLADSSTRSDKPFIAINCAALSESLLEDELFGHVKGAFTGANSDRIGKFEEGNGGTVFLDEIGDMSLSCQAKVLRVLDFGEITPLGSNETRKINVRIICATHRNLERMVEEEKFRSDLLFRLRGIQINVPPLRIRGQDIDILTDYYLEKIRRTTNSPELDLTAEARAAIRAHPWPGNVRELIRVLESASTLAESSLIDITDLPPSIQDAPAKRKDNTFIPGLKPISPEPGKTAELDELDLRILDALKMTAYPGTGRWNVSKASRETQIPRKTFEYRMRKLGLKCP